MEPPGGSLADLIQADIRLTLATGMLDPILLQLVSGEQVVHYAMKKSEVPR